MTGMVPPSFMLFSFFCSGFLQLARIFRVLAGLFRSWRILRDSFRIFLERVRVEGGGDPLRIFEGFFYRLAISFIDPVGFYRGCDDPAGFFQVSSRMFEFGGICQGFLEGFFKFGDFLSILWDYVKVVSILRDLFEKYISNLGISAADFFEGEVFRGWRVFSPIVWDPAGFYQHSDDPAGFRRIFSS